MNVDQSPIMWLMVGCGMMGDKWQARGPPYIVNNMRNVTESDVTD